MSWSEDENPADDCNASADAGSAKQSLEETAKANENNPQNDTENAEAAPEPFAGSPAELTPGETVDETVVTSRNLTALEQAVQAAREHLIRDITDGMQMRGQMKEASLRASAEIYGIAHKLRTDRNLLEEFCRAHELKCIVSTTAFGVAAKVVFKAAGYSGKALDKDASRRARALSYLYTQPNGAVSPDAALEFLRENGGVEGCLRLQREARASSMRGRPTVVAEQPAAQNDSPVAGGEVSAETPPAAPQGDNRTLTDSEWRLVEELRERGAGHHRCIIERGDRELESFTFENDPAESGSSSRDDIEPLPQAEAA